MEHQCPGTKFPPTFLTLKVDQFEVSVVILEINFNFKKLK